MGMEREKHIIKPEDQDFYPKGRGLDAMSCSQSARVSKIRKKYRVISLQSAREKREMILRNIKYREEGDEYDYERRRKHQEAMLAENSSLIKRLEIADSSENAEARHAAKDSN